MHQKGCQKEYGYGKKEARTVTVKTWVMLTNSVAKSLSQQIRIFTTPKQNSKSDKAIIQN